MPQVAHPRCKSKYPPAAAHCTKTLVQCRRRAGPSGFCPDCDPETEARRRTAFRSYGEIRMSREART